MHPDDGMCPHSKAARKITIIGCAPARRRFQHPSSHAAQWWDVPPLGGSQENPSMMGCAPTRRRFQLPSIHTLRWWDFPQSEVKIRSFTDGMCPHSENCVYTLLDGMSPNVKVLTQTYLLAFICSPMRAETLRCWIFPTRSLPLCCRDMPPLRAPICSADGMCPRQEQASLRLPSFEPTGGWNPDSFPLPGSFHILMTGCAPTPETVLLMGYPLYERTTPLLGLLPHWRYRIIDRIMTHIRDRCIQPVAGISPTSN